MAFAYGELGLSDVELAGMTPAMFNLKVKGYRDKCNITESLFRRLAWYTVVPHLDPKKNLTINKFWPMQESGAQAQEKKDEALLTKKQVNVWMKVYASRKKIKE